MSNPLAPLLPFELPFDWESEWQGMPEFKMGNTEPTQRITMNFRDFADVKAFAALIGASVTSRTDTLWFPKQEDYEAPKNFRYIDRDGSAK